MSGDILDVRDLIEKYEELETLIEDGNDGGDEVDELNKIQELLDELKGNGGDEQWRGDWYPILMVRDDYFVEFCQQEVIDCGYIKNDLPYFISNNIDWDGVADEMKYDYSEVEFDGNTYYYR